MHSIRSIMCFIVTMAILSHALPTVKVERNEDVVEIGCAGDATDLCPY